MSSREPTYAIAGSESHPSSSWARCSAASSAAFRRSGGNLAMARSRPASNRLCCSGVNGLSTGLACVPRGIIAGADVYGDRAEVSSAVSWRNAQDFAALFRAARARRSAHVLPLRRLLDGPEVHGRHGAGEAGDGPHLDAVGV